MELGGFVMNLKHTLNKIKPFTESKNLWTAFGNLEMFVDGVSMHPVFEMECSEVVITSRQREPRGCVLLYP